MMFFAWKPMKRSIFKFRLAFQKDSLEFVLKNSQASAEQCITLDIHLTVALPASGWFCTHGKAPNSAQRASEGCMAAFLLKPGGALRRAFLVLEIQNQCWNEREAQQTRSFCQTLLDHKEISQLQWATAGECQKCGYPNSALSSMTATFVVPQEQAGCSMPRALLQHCCCSVAAVSHTSGRDQQRQVFLIFLALLSWHPSYQQDLFCGGQYWLEWLVNLLTTGADLSDWFEFSVLP